jgi:RNA polymerase sigma-70 factor, ECF subfamily
VSTKLSTEFHECAAAFSALPILAEEKDPTLIAAAERGRNQAFEILASRHQGRILRVALRFTRNREDAEDIVQQSFQKAFLHLQRFKGNSSFSTWLTRITINEALMWLRRRRTSPEVPIEQSSAENETAPALEFPDAGPSPEDSCLQRERKRILSHLLNKLTPGLRAAIELREIGELSTQETAGVMGLSVAAVKGRVFHARKKLRAMLKRYVHSAQAHGTQPTNCQSNGISRHHVVCNASD